MNETSEHLPEIEHETGSDKFAVLQVLDTLTHVPDASRAADGLRRSDLPGNDDDAVQLVRDVQNIIMVESVPDYWLSEGGFTPSDWDAASDLAAERGRQARVLRDWLNAVEVQPVA